MSRTSYYDSPYSLVRALNPRLYDARDYEHIRIFTDDLIGYEGPYSRYYPLPHSKGVTWIMCRPNILTFRMAQLYEAGGSICASNSSELPQLQGSLVLKRKAMVSSDRTSKSDSKEFEICFLSLKSRTWTHFEWPMPSYDLDEWQIFVRLDFTSIRSMHIRLEIAGYERIYSDSKTDFIFYTHDGHAKWKLGTYEDGFGNLNTVVGEFENLPSRQKIKPISTLRDSYNRDNDDDDES